MSYNVEALKKLRTSIKLEAHQQQTWGVLKHTGRGRGLETREHLGTTFTVSCPTAACAAGWAVTNEGAKMLFDAEFVEHYGTAEASYCLTEAGKVESIQDYAGEILGLDTLEQGWLFAGHNSTDQVLTYIDEIIAAEAHHMGWTEYQAAVQRKNRGH